MIGIYHDSFIDFLKQYVSSVKVTSKNIIIPCLWCEQNQTKKHYHLYISLEAPIFHCFHNECLKSGRISRLFEKLSGNDNSEKFFDKEKIKQTQKVDVKLINNNDKNIILPDLKEDSFKLKSLYLKGRLKYSIENLKNVKGLIFDIDQFIDINKITIDERIIKIKPYLQSNFIGFLTENKSIIMLRNIDSKSEFKFFKLFITPTLFLDYYKLPGLKYDSNHVVLAEGIFDIFNEQIYDYTNLKKDVKLYAAGLSTSYDSLIKSICFNEKIYRMNLTIISDRGISLQYYRNIKEKNKHIINKMDIFYNKVAKDFGENTVITEKFVM
jgi:hypothetical protein